MEKREGEEGERMGGREDGEEDEEDEDEREYEGEEGTVQGKVQSLRKERMYGIWPFPSSYFFGAAYRFYCNT